MTIDPGEDVAKYRGRYDGIPRLGSNYPLRGGNTQLYEGGIGTPAVISWPAKIKPGKLAQPIHIVD